MIRRYVALGLFVSVAAVGSGACGGVDTPDGDGGSSSSSCNRVPDTCSGRSAQTFVQAAATLDVRSTQIAERAAKACQSLAVGLGADPASISDEASVTERLGWCGQAQSLVQQLGGLTLEAGAAICSFDIVRLVDCEALCTGETPCATSPAALDERCEMHVAGGCAGNCSGDCGGSEVSCSGHCIGVCIGTCDGASSSGSCSGECAGKCEGGECNDSASSNAKCEGLCVGDCDVDFTEPVCSEAPAPPTDSCAGCSSCQGSCMGGGLLAMTCKTRPFNVFGAPSAGEASTIAGALGEIVAARDEQASASVAAHDLGPIGSDLLKEGGDIGQCARTEIDAIDGPQTLLTAVSSATSWVSAP